MIDEPDLVFLNKLENKNFNKVKILLNNFNY